MVPAVKQELLERFSNHPRTEPGYNFENGPKVIQQKPEQVQNLVRPATQLQMFIKNHCVYHMPSNS
ncbi:unnamed protein product [Acanthoscelides obtectus]|uniref:Uncharacterized protein n=1 Tax=Acanthoscelides obtectus TaxID=200917 RepID=A0A9P0PKK4_ACAOB|nr:unnamed protein product [Acanthoscelides obtectus]CAK1640559.1 hypothetical protein AOBTE_LOCUS11799 [Acanthoscelides obtectus]